MRSHPLKSPFSSVFLCGLEARALEPLIWKRGVTLNRNEFHRIRLDVKMTNEKGEFFDQVR